MPNRTVCSVIEEARKCNETRNYSYLSGLLEEIQSLANRMEAALWDQNDMKRMMDDRAALKKELKELKEQVKEEKEKQGLPAGKEIW
jgi:hypothetical protein